MQHGYLFPLTWCNLKWRGSHVVDIYNIAIVKVLFVVGTGIVDEICSWPDFCTIFFCFTFSGNSEPFYERYVSSRLDECSNKEFICWSLNFICSLRSDTWSNRWFINTSESINGVLVIGASGVSTSLFNKPISAKNICVTGLNFLTSWLWKNWSSSFILKVSLQVLFFSMERHILLETWLEIAKFYQDFSRNVFFKRILN